MQRAASETDAANGALAHLGEPPIASIDEPRKTARTVKLRFADVRDACLRSYDWNFAVGRVTLSADPVASLGDLRNRFVLPNDCLAVREVIGLREDDWAVEASSQTPGSDPALAAMLVANVAAPTIRYTRRVEQPALWDALFLEVFQLMLGSALAMPIARSNTLAERLEGRAEAKLKKAKRTDAREKASSRLPNHSSWLDARGRGGASFGGGYGGGGSYSGGNNGGATVGGGPPGPSTNWSIGSVETLPPGSDNDVTISGTPPIQQLHFKLAAGPAGTVTLVPGTATTLPPGSPFDFDLVELAPGKYRLDMAVPAGADGDDGTGTGNVNFQAGTPAAGRFVVAGDSVDKLKDGGAFTAATIPNVPAGNISATNLQAAIAELDLEKMSPADVASAISAYIAAQDVEVFKGAINCSTNPNFPAADAGHVYRVSVAGKIGGASGANVEAGDRLECTVDSTASGTLAAVGANWMVSQVNIDGAVVGPASAVAGNVARFVGTGGKQVEDAGGPLPTKAAGSDIRTGTDDAKFLTAKSIFDAAVAVASNVTGSTTLDFAAGINFALTLTGNLTLNVPSNMKNGQSGVIYFIQDGTGSRTISLNASIKKVGTYTLSTAASTVDRCGYFVRGGVLELTALEKGIA